MLVCFGNFKHYHESVSDIIRLVSTYNNDDDIRFIYSDTKIITIINSALNFDELKNVIDMSINNMVDMYLFFRYTKDFSVKLPHDVFSHLFDKKYKTKAIDLNLKDEKFKFGVGDSIKNEMEKLNNAIDEELNYIDELLKKNRKPKKKDIYLSLDDILEKIHKRGIDSLTKQEQEFLNKLSDNEES